MSSNSDVTQIQASLNDQFAAITKVPFMNGLLLSGINLTSGQANQVNTGLGKTATGYMIFSSSANSTFWNDAFSGTTSVSLHCSSNTTVILWVF